MVRAVIDGKAAASSIGSMDRMPTTMLPLLESLRHPPVFAPAQAIWFECKAVELAAQLFFSPPVGEFFCTRQQRAARERVDRARNILRERLTDPPSLEELGRIVACRGDLPPRLGGTVPSVFCAAAVVVPCPNGAEQPPLQ